MDDGRQHDQDIQAQIAALMSTMAALRVFIVLSKPVDPLATIPPDVLLRHLRYQIELEKQGVLVAAGPLVDDDGGLRGPGVYVLRAADESAARRTLDRDPVHVEKVRTYTLSGWRINEGRLHVALDLSSGKHTVS